VVSRQKADIVDTLHLRDIAMATSFWLSMGYNFGCVIASDMLFDSRVGFQGQAIRWRHSQFRGSKGHCHGNHFWLSIYGVHICASWRIRLNRPYAAVMRLYVKLLWPNRIGLLIKTSWVWLPLPYNNCGQVVNWCPCHSTVCRSCRSVVVFCSSEL